MNAARTPPPQARRDPLVARRLNRGMKSLGALPILAVAVGLAVLLWRSQQHDVQRKVSGLLEAHEIRLGSRVGGRVARVLVEEGARVTAGQVLVELEAFDLAERRAGAAAVLATRQAERHRIDLGYRVEEIEQARARRHQAAARLERAEHGPRAPEIAAARARVDQAQAELALTDQRWQRQHELLAQRVAAQDAMDQAENERRAAQAVLARYHEELTLLEQGSRPEEIAEAKALLAEADAALALRVAGFTAEERTAAAAAVDAAAAALGAIDRQLAETVVKAPTAALVESLDLRPGDLVAANAPILALREPSPLWVRGYIPETSAALKVGSRVDVSVDAFPDRRFAAEVTFVATEAEFTPRNAQTPEERSKQVFRIKATLREGLDVLRPGMAADVWLDASDRS